MIQWLFDLLGVDNYPDLIMWLYICFGLSIYVIAFCIEFLVKPEHKKKTKEWSYSYFEIVFGLFMLYFVFGSLFMSCMDITGNLPPEWTPQHLKEERGIYQRNK